MSLEEVSNRIIDVMLRELELNVSPDEIRQAVRLDDLFGMDSIAVTELMIGIEKEFSVRFPTEDLKADIFRNVNALAEYVQMLLRSDSMKSSGR